MKKTKKTESIEESILSLVDNIQKMVDSLVKEIKGIRTEVIKMSKKSKKIK
jgi:Mg2+ and Co2+ transporter CorA